MTTLDWQDHAACAGEDPDLFFPTNGGPTNKHVAAKHICAQCPVRAQCLAYALSRYEQHGIWGGTTPDAAPCDAN